MVRSFHIAAALARRRAVRIAAAVLAVAGALAGSLPLLEAPGYELGQAGAFLAVLVAPFVGLAAARLERPRDAPSPLAAWGGAAAVVAALAAVPVLGAVARAALGPCSALGPAAWFLPLLALPSALLAAALAVAAGFLARGRAARAGAIYAGVALASLAWSLRAAYAGPAAFVFDPLLGAWPGPIYDEAVVPDLRVVLLRLAAGAEAVAVAAVAEAFVRSGRRLRDALAPALAAALAAAVAVGAGVALERLDLSGSRAALARALGARRDGTRCTLVYPAEKAAPAVAALLADCEFQQADVARALGLADPPHVTAYVYRSAAEKRRLVGAATTEYAKPWLGEVHVVDAPPPHPILRHEVVHAVAARAARGPLGVPARALVLVNAGLVEGLAAALETPRGRWTVHEWSRAARDEGFLPDVRAILGPTGFWAEPPARAYTAAGSFLAFLLDARGPAVVREAYRTGDLARAAGVPLDALVAAWQAFLDGVSPAPGLAAEARARLSRPSIFGRPCAREVAAVEGRAAAAAGAGRVEEACALYGRAAALSGSPRDLVAAAAVLARAGDLARADAAYAEAARAAGDAEVALRASIDAARADLAWRRGDVAAASAGWSSALATEPERAEARTLQAKIAAAADPVLGAAIRDYLLGLGDPTVALARVAELRRPLSSYLVGRALALRGEAGAASSELARAVEGPLPPMVAREAALLLGEARCASGDTSGGARALEGLSGRDATPADRARAQEALRRCAFLAGGR